MNRFLHSQSLSELKKHGDVEGDLNATAGGGDDPAKGGRWRREARATGGAGFRSVQVELDGVLQGLQRADAEVQAGDADGRDHNGVQGWDLRIHVEISGGHVVPEAGGGGGERQQPTRSRHSLHHNPEARVRNREDQAKRSVLSVHASRVDL